MLLPRHCRKYGGTIRTVVVIAAVMAVASNPWIDPPGLATWAIVSFLIVLVALTLVVLLR